MIITQEKALQGFINNHALGSKLRNTVETLPDMTMSSVMQTIATQAPAIYTYFSRLNISDNYHRYEFGVVLFAKNARGFAEALQGDANTIGLYEMIDTTIAVIQQQASWTAHRVTSIRNSLLDKGFFGAIVTCDVKAELDYLTDIDALDNFATFDNKVDLDLSTSDDLRAHDSLTLPVR